MEKQTGHKDLNGIAAILAATWLFIVSGQAVVHLLRYQMQLPPEWVWRLDFTPAYLPMLIATAVFLIARRFTDAGENPARKDSR